MDLQCWNAKTYGCTKSGLIFEKNASTFLSACMIPIYLIPSSAVNVMGTHVGAGENFKLADFPENN